MQVVRAASLLSESLSFQTGRCVSICVGCISPVKIKIEVFAEGMGLWVF